MIGVQILDFHCVYFILKEAKYTNRFFISIHTYLYRCLGIGRGIFEVFFLFKKKKNNFTFCLESLYMLGHALTTTATTPIIHSKAYTWSTTSTLTSATSSSFGCRVLLLTLPNTILWPIRPLFCFWTFFF